MRAVGRLSRCGVVEHRLVEIGDDIARARGSFGANARVTTPVPAAVSKTALGDKDAARRAMIHGVRLENQRRHIAVVVFRNRSGEHLVGFQHGSSPFTRLMARMITIGLSASLIGRLGSSTFRLSTTAVSMSLTGSCFSSESAPRPFHHGIRGRGGTICCGGLAVRLNGRSKRTNELTSSIVPRGTSFHRLVELEFSPIVFDSYGSHAAAASRVQRNSVPSTHMRCMITASRRASATIAFFIPRRLAICIAQALSQDHFFERSMA